MGSAESTGRSNRTDDEEETRPANGSSGEGSGGAGTAIAVAAAGAAVAAWGISRMLSAGTDTDRQEQDDEVAVKAPGMEAFLINSGTSSHRQYESKHISYPTPTPNPTPNSTPTWSRPPRGRFKMNTDGRALPNPPDTSNPGPSGYGGILRNDRGEWVRGFRGFIGESDGLTAEFYGILKGLQILDKRRHRGSILESDCEPAILWINDRDRSSPSGSPIIIDNWEIITECRRLIDKNETTLKHISENINKCADKLAKMATDKRDEYEEIEYPPPDIELLVKADLGSSYLGHPY